MIVLKEFEFDAAHYLPEYNGKCERLHGHTYKLISVWVWNKLKDLLHGDNYDLYEVEVWETKTSGCIYRGDL